MTDIRADEIDELLRLAEAATAGPWEVSRESRTNRVVNPAGDAELGNWTVAADVYWHNNAAFIAVARNAIPAIRALRERLSAKPYVQEINRDFGEHDKPPRGRFQDTSTPVEADVAEQTECLARWMLANGFATGHGDNVSDLIDELDWQFKERSQIRPVAWMRGLHQTGTVNGPDEYGAEFDYGDDAPTGEGWIALYSGSTATRRLDPSVAGAEVLAERESCAKIADESAAAAILMRKEQHPPKERGTTLTSWRIAARDIAAAIRARSARPVAAGEEG